MLARSPDGDLVAETKVVVGGRQFLKREGFDRTSLHPERLHDPLLLHTPQHQGANFGDMPEVLVGGQQRQAILQAKLRVESIDRSDLDSPPSAGGAQFSGTDVRSTIRNEQRQRCKCLKNACSGTGTLEALQQFLEDESGGEQLVTGLKRTIQKSDFGDDGRTVATQGQRPDACVDEELQERLRSPLRS